MNMKEWYNPRDFIDLIERFDPFGYKESDGKVRTFEDYGRVYYFTFEQLITMFPRGYIDLPLFVCTQTGMPLPECQRLVKEWKSTGIDSEEYLIDLWNDSPERTSFLKNLLTSLHLISGTTFNVSYFQDALERFNLRNEKISVKERTESGAIVGIENEEEPCILRK